MVLQRVRITFVKGPEIRYTSHLDLARIWERVFRRARLPLAYSQGFNPRPKMQLASALPLGFTSRCEVLDVFLQQPIEPDEFVERLSDQLPAGLTVLAVNEVEPGGPALQSQLRYVEYRVTISANVARAEVVARMAELLAADSLPRERRGKSYDLRPLIDRLWIEGQGDATIVSSQYCGADFPVCRLDRLESLPHTLLPQPIEKIRTIHLGMWLHAGPQGTGRPDEVVEALGLADVVLSIERRRLMFEFDSLSKDRYNSGL